MILYTDMLVNNQQVNIVLLAILKDKDSELAFSSVQMLQDTELLNILQDKGYPVFIDSVSGCKQPFVSCDQSTDVYNITKFYSFVKERKLYDVEDKALTQIQGIIKQGMGIEVSLETTRLVLNACSEINSYLRGELSFEIKALTKLTRNPDRTLELIREINFEHSQPNYIRSGINKTEFMRTPSDHVFLEIPKYEDIRADLPISIPKEQSVRVAYRTDKFSTINYKSALEKTDDIRTIVGNPDNNDMPLQDNEMDFYNALKELMDYGISQEYGDKDPTKYKNHPVSSRVVKDYLIDLAITVASWGWFHTGAYPTSLEQITDDSEKELDILDPDGDKGNEPEAIYGRKGYRPVNNDLRNFVEADNAIKSFIEGVSIENPYAACEAVVKLLRWGSRKPSRLKLDGSDKYLNLENYRVNSASGSFSTLEVKKSGTRIYTPYKIIMANSRFADTSYLRDHKISSNILEVPVGLLCIKEYVNGTCQLVAFSMLDVVKNVEEHKDEIYGLTLDSNDKIKFNLDIDEEDVLDLGQAVSQIANNTDSTNVYYTSDSFKDMFLALEIPVTKVSHLSVLDYGINDSSIGFNINSQQFESAEDLTIKSSLSNIPKMSYITTHLVSKLLPIVFDVDKKYKEVLDDIDNSSGMVSLEDVLNMYSLSMIRLGSNIDVLDKEEQGSTLVNNTINQLENKLSKLNAFKDTNVQEDNRREGDVDVNINDMITKLEPSDQVAVVYREYNKEDGTIGRENIGYVCINKIKGRYIFAKPDFKCVVNENQKLNIKAVIKVALHDYYAALMGKPQSCVVRFNDDATFEYFANLLAKYKVKDF